MILHATGTLDNPLNLLKPRYPPTIQTHTYPQGDRSDTAQPQSTEKAPVRSDPTELGYQSR